MVPVPLHLGVAGAAVPVLPRLPWWVFVPLWAVSLSSVLRPRSDTGQDVLFRRYLPKVIGIDAVANPADVVYFQPLLDSPLEQVIRNTMRPDILAADPD